MADSIVIVELLVDSGPAIAGAQAVITPLEAVAVAAQAAAGAVDKLGVALDAIGAGSVSVSAVAASSAASVAALTGSFEELNRGSQVSEQFLARLRQEVEKHPAILQAAAAATQQFGAAHTQSTSATQAATAAVQQHGTAHTQTASATQVAAAAAQQLGQTHTQTTNVTHGATAAVQQHGAAHGQTTNAIHAANAAHGGLHLTVREGTEAYHTLTELIEGKYLSSLQSATVLTGLLAAGHQLLEFALNPVILSIGALGVVLAAVSERVQEVDSLTRQFGASAKLLGTEHLAGAEELVATFEQLRDSGIGAAGALKIVNDIRLSPTINPAAIQALGDMGAKLSAINTGNLAAAPEFTKQLTTAIEGGIVPLSDYAIKIGAITGAQAAGFIEAARYKGSIAEVQVVVQAIKDHLDGIETPLTDLQKALIEVAKTWNEFIDELVKGGGAEAFAATFKFVVGEVENVASNIKRSFDDAKKIYDEVKAFLPTQVGAGGVQFATGSGAAVTPQSQPQPGLFGTPPGGLIGQFIPSLGLGTLIEASFKDVAANISSMEKTTFDYLRSPDFLRGFGSLGQSLTPENDNTAAVKGSTEKTQQLIDATGKLVEALSKPLGNLPAGSASGIGGAPLSVGGAIAGQGLFGALAQLESSGQNVTQRISDGNSDAGTPGRGFFQIIDPTWQRFASPDILAQYKSAIEAPFEVQQQVVSNIPLNQFGARTIRGLQSQFGPLDTSRTIGELTGGASTPLFDVNAALGGTGAGGTALPPVTGINPVQQEAFAKAINENRDALNRQTEAVGLSGLKLQYYNAWQTSVNDSIHKGYDEVTQTTRAWDAVNAVHDRAAKALDRETQFTRIQTEAQLESVGATRQSEAAGIAQEALGLAEQKTMQNTGNFVRLVQTNRAAAFAESSDNDRRAAQQLEVKAATEAAASEKTIKAMDQQLAADQRLAAGYSVSTAAGKEAAIINQTLAITHNASTGAEAAHLVAMKALDDATKSGDQARVGAAQLLVAETEKTDLLTQAQLGLAKAKLAAEDASKNAESLNQATQNLKDQSDLVTAQLALQGQATEQITAQLEILRAQQKVKKDHYELTLAINQAEAAGDTPLADKLRISQQQQQTSETTYLQEVAADAAQKIALADAERATSRLNDAARSVADTISSQLGTALDTAFSGQKAVSWGDTMKTILRDLLKQILEFTLIKPAIGSALGALGFDQVAQQFGSLGSVFGGGGAIDPVSGLTTATTNGTGGIGSLLGGSSPLSAGISAISGISKLGSLFSGDGALSGVGSFFGGIFGGGSSALPSAAALLDAAPTAALGEGLVSSAALSTEGIGAALSGAGGAASGILGAATAAIPYVGAAIAVGTLLSGILGNKKPSLASSGDVLDLASNSISGFSSSGNAQNDASVRQISTSLQQFVQSIQQQTGGTVPTGGLNVVATTKGIETHYSGELGSVNAKFADAHSAISGLELAITQNLTGVSDTLKAVLTHVTDPSQIQAAVTFATAYDNLKKAADSAFSSISTDTFQVGPFATALANLQKTFGDLTTQANQFGLSLDPINAGLAEATKRLQTDFGTSLDQALNSANASDFVNQLQAVSKTFAVNTQEAQALGLGSDAGTQGKIAQIEAAQAAALLAPLTADQLQTVIAQLGKTNPEIAGMAQAVLNAGLAATGATTSLTNLATGIKAVEDLANSLRTGQLSGLPPAQAAAAAGGSYQTALSAALAAGKNVTSDQLSALAASGTAAIQASQAAYGEAPQTAALRNTILGGLGQVTAITGPSTAIATAASPASAIQAALGASPAVQAAQVAAVMAALHTAGVPGYAGGTGYTAPGAILVGEAGPELITQAGGLSVTPISAHAGWAWHGSSASGASGNAMVVDRINALIAEVAALRKQTQGGQVQQMNDMAQQTGYLGQIDRKAGPGVVQPRRQSAGR